MDEWSARRRDLYQTTHNNHNRQTSTSHGGIRTHNLSKRGAADLRLRQLGHWDFKQIDWECMDRIYLGQDGEGRRAVGNM